MARITMMTRVQMFRSLLYSRIAPFRRPNSIPQKIYPKPIQQFNRKRSLIPKKILSSFSTSSKVLTLLLKSSNCSGSNSRFQMVDLCQFLLILTRANNHSRLNLISVRSRIGFNFSLTMKLFQERPPHKLCLPARTLLVQALSHQIASRLVLQAP